jgi:hypothetical protein
VPSPISVNITANGGGLTIQSSQQVIANVTAALNPTLDPARPGTVTRSSNNAGTLTLETGHGIATGNRLDVFWLDPTTGQQRCQHKITAGTVSGNSVPISGGLGDNLPPLAATAITVQRVSEFDFLLNTPDLIALSVGGNAGGKVVLENAGGTVVHHQTLTSGGGGATWLTGSGSSPVSDTVAKAFLSNAVPTSTNTIQVLAGLTG